METTNEFLRGPGARIPRPGGRRWQDDVKARIVAETLEPGTTVAGKCGVLANPVSSWRRRAKDGTLVLSAPMQDRETDFAPPVVFDIDPTREAEEPCSMALLAGRDAVTALIAGAVTQRMDGHTPTSRIAESLRARGGNT